MEVVPWLSASSAGSALHYLRKSRTLAECPPPSRQADGTPYPGVREQVQRHLVGTVLAALHAGRPGTPWSAWWWAPTRAAVRGYSATPYLGQTHASRKTKGKIEVPEERSF